MRHSFLFNNFTNSEYDAIVSVMDFRSVALDEKEAIVNEGDKVNNFWYVNDGVLHTVRQYYDGDVDLVQVYSERDYLGLDLACSRTRRSAFKIVASSPAVLTAINANLFSNKAIALNLREKLLTNALKILANESLRKQVKIDVLYRKSLRARICTFLAYMQTRFESNIFDIDMNREQLSQYLGVNRSALSNEISKLRDEGIIECRKGHFVILTSNLGASALEADKGGSEKK